MYLLLEEQVVLEAEIVKSMHSLGANIFYFRTNEQKLAKLF